MLPSKTAIENQGSLGGQNVKMTFDDFLQSVLIDLYSDPELAVIRELSTNALDSHKEAGQTRPIEITTPSYLSNKFIVKDYGVGLSVDDIVNIYSKYGASTKRSTNEQAGMLGLGCKSPLTYTNQFTVTAVKNGMRIVVLVYRTEDGSGAMEIVDESLTDESNGVEIAVPTKASSAFKIKAEKFFAFWEKGSVLVDGKEPFQYENRVKITDNIYLYQGSSSDVFVMGGISYALTEGAIVSSGYYTQHSYFLVAFVDIGSVDFTPSREALHYTTKTKAVINSVMSEFKGNFDRAVREALNKCESYMAAFKLFDSLHYRYSLGKFLNDNDKFYWKDKEIIQDIGGFKGTYSISHSRFFKKDYFSLKSLPGNAVLYNYDLKGISSSAREKINIFLHQKSVKEVLVCEELPGFDDLYTETILMDWNDVKQIKVASKPRIPAEQKPKDKYDVIFKDGTQKWSDDISGTIAYISPAQLKEITPFNYRALSKLFDWDCLVIIQERSWNKFLRAFPTAVNAMKDGAAQITKFKESLTEEERLHCAIAAPRSEWYDGIDPAKIDDPALRANLEARSQRDNYLKKIEKIQVFHKLQYFFRVPMDFYTYRSSDIFGDYNLIPSYMPGDHLEEVIVYVNNWYHYKKSKEKNEI